MNNILKESAYSINKAVKFLKTNKLVSLKTETVYGLACDPSSIHSIKKLYIKKINQIKKRKLLLLVNFINHVFKS